MLFPAVFCFLSLCPPAQFHKILIGGLFHDEHDQKAFHAAANNINQRNENSPIELEAESFLISPYNTFDYFSKACALLERGIVAVFGPSTVHASTYIQSLLDRKEIPHIETHWDRNLQRHQCLLNLHPHPSVLIQSLMSVLQTWHWKTFAIIYDTEERLSTLSGFVSLYKSWVTLKRLDLDDYETYRTSLTSVRKSGQRNVLLVCSIDILEEVLRQAQQVGMMTDRHNYIIASLDLQTIDLAPFQFSGANITGFRVVNPEERSVLQVAEQVYDSGKGPPGWRLRLETALIFDAVELFHSAVLDLTLAEEVVIRSVPLFCNGSGNWNSGHTIVNYMKSKNLVGLTGILHFDVEGFRRDFVLDVLELTPGGLLKVGSWHSKEGISVTRPRSAETTSAAVEEGTSLTNKTFTVITCLTTPYGMLKETTARLEGNDRFEGFGIDLIDELSAMLGFNYTIIIQEDGYNGNFDPDTNQWNGLIGSIISGRADLAIADLTVTAERESAVDFTLQFMNLGISILYKKPKPVPPSLFMFVSPFSYTVWILLIVTYFIVSLCFFIMGRLSPEEWTNPYPCIDEPEFLINQFSIKNSFWFTIGSLMQQGTEIAPIGISTRTAAGVWWFFTLIIVSSYTANLAAFLTVETLVTPFSNVKELSEQKEISWGAKRGGATANFFKNAGNDSVRLKIWNYMNSHDSEMTENNDEGVERTKNEAYAFFMESTTIEYVVERHCSLASVGPPLDDKGYAIAMKKNSSYRNDLSTAILKLQETGRISALKEKWWKEKRGASNCAAQGGDESAATPLNLQNVGGVFLVLFVGTFIGFILSFIELGFRVYLNTKKLRKKFREEFVKEMKFFIKFKENSKEVGTAEET